ncbi:MAG: glycosyltransferase family 2 protein [Gammaproteobacteria bacterium]|nr:glycosyltransferase family 2 protein [Gammaproteobacteria bacterium]
MSEQLSTQVRVSVVIPARNEAPSVGLVVKKVLELLPGAELIVVNDGSSDATSAVARAAGATVIDHPYSKGNGASIKTGARAARGDILFFMDADGQHAPESMAALLRAMDEGYDMVVGARANAGQASMSRLFANSVYNRFATLVVGHHIEDLTSGFRAVRREKFLEFLYLLPNGFSYPTTITMAFFRSGYSVKYLPIEVGRRDGESHISALKDGLKFMLIIFRVCTLYSPLKLFFPLAVLQFATGICYYGYTYFTEGRFTNMSVLFLTSALTTFLIGLVSEQITALIFKHDELSR